MLSPLQRELRNGSAKANFENMAANSKTKVNKDFFID
jgi:hypothetical protein